MVYSRTEEAIKWLNTFDLVRSKETERIILTLERGNHLIKNSNAFDKENRQRQSERYGKVVQIVLGIPLNRDSPRVGHLPPGELAKTHIPRAHWHTPKLLHHTDEDELET